MNREALDRWCERGLFALLLAILVYGPLALGAVRAVDFAIIEGLTVGVLALWSARLWVNERPRLLWPPICWAVLAFAVYAVARYATADIEYEARQEMVRVLVCAFLFLAVVNNLHRQEMTQAVAFTLIFLAMAISVYALYQFLSSSQRVWTFTTPYRHQGTGTYISPNHLGGFLEMLLPLGLAYTLASRLKPLPRVFLGYASLVILAGIAVTVSRGAWLSTVLALALFFGVLLFQRAHRLPALVLLVIMAGSVVFLAPKSHFFRARAQQLYATGRLDDDGRFDVWRTAIRVWQENIWWGVGPAHFDYRFRNFRPELVQVRPERAHNDYLNTLADWGIVGAALVAAAWGLLGLGLWKTWRFIRGTPRDLGQPKTSNKFAFVLGAAAGLAAILFHSVVDFNMHIPANAILAVTLMALLSSHLRFATDRYWFTARPWVKVLASVIFGAGMVYLSAQARRGAREFAWLARAREAPRFSAEQVELLSRAFAIEPRNGETAYAIGEALRVESQEGAEQYLDSQPGDYRRRAEKAMEWFERARRLNPWNPAPCLGYGWCLDWLQRTGESGPYFDRAEELDPASYVTMSGVGRHYVELGNFAAAKPWFERSLRLQPANNPIAQSYLQIVDVILREAATNDIRARLIAPAP